MNQLLACDFHPCIDKATRVTETSAILIDNILTNVHNNNSMSGIWVADVADHVPVYITFSLDPEAPDKNVPRTYQKRFYSGESLAQFQTCLSECDWSDIMGMENANVKYNHFIQRITVMHDEHFPLKSVTVDPKRRLKPWITNAILNSVRKKNTMYKNYLKTRSHTLLDKCKTYKNRIQTIIRNSEKLYYSNTISQLKDNMSKTWKVINTMINKSKPKKDICQIDVNGTVVTDANAIADKFNNYFTNVSADLAENIPVSSKEAINFIPKNMEKSLFFAPKTEHEISYIIANLRQTDSVGHDNTPLKLGIVNLSWLKYCLI